MVDIGKELRRAERDATEFLVYKFNLNSAERRNLKRPEIDLIGKYNKGFLHHQSGYDPRNNRIVINFNEAHPLEIISEGVSRHIHHAINPMSEVHCQHTGEWFAGPGALARDTIGPYGSMVYLTEAQKKGAKVQKLEPTESMGFAQALGLDSKLTGRLRAQSILARSGDSKLPELARLPAKELVARLPLEAPIYWHELNLLPIFAATAAYFMHYFP